MDRVRVTACADWVLTGVRDTCTAHVRHMAAHGPTWRHMYGTWRQVVQLKLALNGVWWQASRAGLHPPDIDAALAAGVWVVVTSPNKPYPMQKRGCALLRLVASAVP